MSRARLLLIAFAAFGVAHAALFEATTWISVYLLDWWDPKFGDQAGNIRFSHQIMTLFGAAAIFSFAPAVALHRRWIQTAPPRIVAWASAAGAILSHSAQFAFGLATRHIPVSGAVMIVGWSLLLAGPAVFGTAAFALARRLPMHSTLPVR
jgi:hypothetical protein